jgi:prolipoprotein diacylglyceryltransferase
MNRRPRREGVLTLTFGLWYGSTRLVTDFLRVDKRFFGLTGSQWTALTVALISAALLIWWAARPRPGPGERGSDGEYAGGTSEDRGANGGGPSVEEADSPAG